MWIDKLDSVQLQTFSNSAPKTIQFIVGGDVILSGEKNEIGQITGNRFGANTNIQSDNVIQSYVEQNDEIQKALEELEQEINSISDQEKKEDASMYFEMLLKFMEENKPSRAERCINKLDGILSSSASLIKIAGLIGLTL